MVKYLCDICEGKYDSLDEAEKCENQGLVGPGMKPGLLFSHKDVDNGFFVFYNESSSLGHNRVYLVEEILEWSVDHISGLGWGRIVAPSLEKFLESYRISTDEEIKCFNEQLSGDIKGISRIRIYMEKFGIKELHNNFDLEDYFNSIKK